MSVIAKLMVRNAVDFGTGSFIELGCLCDNDLMAAYAESEGDRLFTKYSPWGEMRLHQRSGWAVFTKDEQHVADPSIKPAAFYVMLLDLDEVADEAQLKKASTYLKVGCHSKTKYAGEGSRVELRESFQKEENAYGRRDLVVQKLSWKMQVDNPPAEERFVPGREYWLAFYDARVFDRDGTIRSAHGHPEAAA